MGTRGSLEQVMNNEMFKEITGHQLARRAIPIEDTWIHEEQALWAPDEVNETANKPG